MLVVLSSFYFLFFDFGLDLIFGWEWRGWLRVLGHG